MHTKFLRSFLKFQTHVSVIPSNTHTAYEVSNFSKQVGASPAEISKTLNKLNQKIRNIIIKFKIFSKIHYNDHKTNPRIPPNNSVNCSRLKSANRIAGRYVPEKGHSK